MLRKFIGRIYFWTLRASYKKGLALRESALQLIALELRLTNPSFRLYGESEQDDAVIRFVTFELLGMAVPPELKKQLEGHGEVVAAVLDTGKGHPSIQKLLSTYFLADAFAHELLRNTSASEASFGRSRMLDPTSKALDTKMVFVEWSRIQNRIQLIRAELADRASLKISITLSDMTAAAGLLSILFVVSGFLYVSYFFKQFSIDVAKFFTLSDYLAASVEQVQAAALAALVGLVSMFAGAQAASRRTRAEWAQFKRSSRRTDLVIWVFGISCALGFAWTLLVGRPLFALATSAGVVFSLVAAAEISERYFEERLPTMFVISLTLTFLVNIFVQAHRDAHVILTSSTTSADSLSISLKSGSRWSSQLGRAIGANSGFLFVLTKDKKNVIVFPRDAVEAYSIERK